MSDCTYNQPWNTFFKELKSTYGASPYVKVQSPVQVRDDYLIRIDVSHKEVAFALRQVVVDTIEYTSPKATLFIKVFGPNGDEIPISTTSYTPQTLAKVFCTALKFNSFFMGAILTDGKLSPGADVGNVALVMKKEIIQFFDKNQSDLCSDFNEVAAKVFATVSRLEYPQDLCVSFSTYNEKCKLQKSFYCTGHSPYLNRCQCTKPTSSCSSTSHCTSKNYSNVSTMCSPNYLSTVAVSPATNFRNIGETVTESVVSKTIEC